MHLEGKTATVHHLANHSPSTTLGASTVTHKCKNGALKLQVLLIPTYVTFCKCSM